MGLRGCVTKHRRGVLAKRRLMACARSSPGSVLILVNSLKGVSSRVIGQKQYPSVSKKRWGTQSTIALWSPSYFAPSCGGSPIAIIGQYIEQTGHLWCPRYSSSPLTERISAHPVKVPHESFITSLKKGLTRFSVSPFDERVSTACRGNA